MKSEVRVSIENDFYLFGSVNIVWEKEEEKERPIRNKDQWLENHQFVNYLGEMAHSDDVKKMRI